MDLKKILDELYKKYRRETMLITVLFITFFIPYFFNFISQKVNELEQMENAALVNKITIENHEKKLAALENKTLDIVARPSFNQYIARIDDENHKQESFNDDITRKMGMLEGRFSVMEQIFYDLNRNQVKVIGAHNDK